ncbi:MAG TPA: DNA-directed RNA polymerase subunit beta', partial [Patescibacteria group bacterium]|nr:DNA-directed RNA polymerase subunit beta' [Patescibacteria group bacterium]
MDQKMKKMKDVTFVDFSSLKILLASKEDMLNWSYGEVTKPETINYRTLRPEKDGLFDERIFGPTKDWECYCGKYKRIRYKGITCDKCGVEVTLARVRRERMGHITLSCPVSHVWFFKGASSPLATVLDISQRSLESVIYYASYLVVGIDEEKKKEALEHLSETLDKRKLALEEQKKEEEAKLTSDETQPAKDTTEQKKLINEERSLMNRQKIARLNERFADETKKLEEISSALANLLKSLKVSSVLSEDEYFKILEYDIPIFFTIKTGAEAI